MPELIERLREAVDDLDDVRDRSIIGGAGLMWRGNLLCGVVSGNLVVRVGKSGMRDALAEPGATAMTMAGRSASGWVSVDAATLDDAALRAWVRRGVAFVETLPAK